MDILIVILLIIVIGLIFFNTFKNSNDTNQSDDFLKGIDHSIETQRTTIGELSKDIQSFNEPLSKLNRYLSGGTLAGKFGEWSLESIIKDIFHSNQYESNAEVIPGSGKRVEFIIKLPENRGYIKIWPYQYYGDLGQSAHISLVYDFIIQE